MQGVFCLVPLETFLNKWEGRSCIRWPWICLPCLRDLKQIRLWTTTNVSLLNST